MKIKKLLLAVCATVFAFCLTMPCLASVSADTSVGNANQTSWIFERTENKKIDGSNYHCVQLFTSYASAPQFNGSQEFWGFSVKNHLNAKATIRFGFCMGGGVTVWMGGADSKYYFEDKNGTVTELQGVQGQNVQVPENFDGIVYWNPAQGFGYNDKMDVLTNNNFRVKGLQVGYDFRSGYEAKLEFGTLYVADIQTGDAITVNNKECKGNLDVLDVGYPKWANLGSPTAEAVTAMQNCATVSQVDLYGTYDYASIEVSGAFAEFDIADTFDSNGLSVVGTTAEGKKYIIPADLCTVDSSAVNLLVSGTYEVTVSFKNVSSEYSVQVKEDNVKSIEVADANYKFVEGEEFGSDCLVVNKVYASGKKEALNKDEYTVDSSSVNTSEVGEYTVTVTYGELTCEYTVNVYENKWVFYNRVNNKKVDGNTYHGAFLQTDSENGTPEGSQRYLGIRIKNLLPYSNTRIRFGFTYNDGKGIVWMFGTGTYYMVDTEGNISKDEIIGQYIFVKPNFEGWIFVDTQDMYGKDKYNGQPLQGVVVGYDFRSVYTVYLGYNAIGVADFAESETDIKMSDFKTLAYFGDMDVTDVKQLDINGKPSEEQYGEALKCIEFKRLSAGLFSDSNVTDFKMFASPEKTEYASEDGELDLTGGAATVTYTLGEETAEQRFYLTSSLFTVSGFTAGEVGTQTITVTYLGKTLSFDVTVQNSEDLVPVGVAIKTMPTKVKYLVNEVADWTGGVVTITYASGRTEDVSFDDAKLNIVGFSTISARENMNVYITLADDSTISASFKISVTKAGDGNKTEEKGGCGSSLSGTSAILTVCLLCVTTFAVLRKRKHD